MCYHQSFLVDDGTTDKLEMDKNVMIFSPPPLPRNSAVGMQVCRGGQRSVTLEQNLENEIQQVKMQIYVNVL